MASISWWPFAGQDDYRLGPVYTVAADCYVLAALAVGAVIAWRTCIARPVADRLRPPVPAARRAPLMAYVTVGGRQWGTWASTA